MQRILHKRFVGQGFQRRSALGYEHKNRFLCIRILQYTGRVIRIHIADKPGGHFETAVFPGPVFQRQVHSPGAEITPADTDLHNCGEFFTFLIDNFTPVYFPGEFGNPFLLFRIKHPFVHPVSFNGIPQLSSGQLMKHAPLFSGIDYFTVVQRFIFFRKPAFIRQFCQLLQEFVIHLLRRV